MHLWVIVPPSPPSLPMSLLHPTKKEFAKERKSMSDSLSLKVFDSCQILLRIFLFSLLGSKLSKENLVLGLVWCILGSVFLSTKMKKIIKKHFFFVFTNDMTLHLQTKTVGYIRSNY